MRIAVVHTFYQQRGGEDAVVEQEVEQLRAAGHHVSTFFTHNRLMQQHSRLKQLILSLWNRGERRRFRDWLIEQKCDVVHLHNTFPYLSPSVMSVPHRLGIPLVATLHNYRLVCPAATLFRANTDCQLCLRRFGLLSAVRHRCYRKSRAASLAVVFLLVWSRLLRIWQRQVDLVFLFHPLQQQMLRPARLHPLRIVFKANAVSDAPDRPIPDNLTSLAQDFLAVGRLSPEKGIVALAQWWHAWSIPLRLTVAGSGGEEEVRQLEQLAERNAYIRYAGKLPQPEVALLMRQSRFLVFPSLWYEGMPMVILEALAQGLPILARRLGAPLFLLRQDFTGYFFDGEADLSEKLNLLAKIDHARYCLLSKNCQQEQRQRYSSHANVLQLEANYRKVAHSRKEGK